MCVYDHIDLFWFDSFISMCDINIFFVRFHMRSYGLKIMEIKTSNLVLTLSITTCELLI
jgi:hypothetical protein